MECIFSKDADFSSATSLKKYFTVNVLLKNVTKHFEQQFIGKFFAGGNLNNS